MKKWLKLIGLIYLFILSIELIKQTSILLGPTIKEFLLENLTPIKAIATGWFTTSIAQSSGAVGTMTATFAGNHIISLKTAIFIIIGSSLGTTITALAISLITVTQKRRDFRHGFEIGLCYALFSAIVVLIAFLLEYFFQFISRSSLLIISLFGESTSSLPFPDIVNFTTSPITNLLVAKGSIFLTLLFAFLILIFSLRYLSKSIIDIFGGEEKTKKKIGKYFESKWKTYLLGVVLTGIVFSSSITIGLLVPLAASRLISLKKTIPFILGADLGTSTDILIAALIINKPLALATAISYFILPLMAAILFLPNTHLLFKTTKYISKKLIHISRKKALYILLAFLLIPLLIILIF